MVQSDIYTLTTITLICAAVSARVPASSSHGAAHSPTLFERAELIDRAEPTCSLPGFSSCNKNNLPSNFCCPAGAECVAFNNGKSAICCPAGKDCSTIQTISCDLTQQNATAHPSSQLFTTELTTNMDTCGSKCCPQGYSCKNGQCTMSSGATSASSAASSQKPSSTASNAASSTSKPTSSPIGAKSSASASAAAASHDHGNQGPSGGVIAGVLFAGIFVGAVIATAIFCCIARRQKKQNPPDSPPFSSVAASVSDPIYQPQDPNGFRTDFLRREARSPTNTCPTSRVRSLFSRRSTIRSNKSRDAPVDGIGRSIQPRTPENAWSPNSSLRREPSMESIKIYSPPNGGLGRPNTTFTDMMADAGFKAGEPYLGSPGRVDPRSRKIGGV